MQKHRKTSKITGIILAALLVMLLCVPVSAINPFQRITATEDNVAGGSNGSHETKENPDALYDASKTFNLYWDTDTETWAHGNVNTIAFLAPYGIGYGHKFGTQYIENLDFGANGADKVTISLTWPDADVEYGGLGIYLNVNPVKDKNAQPLAVINGVFTDGFDEDAAKDYTVDVSIPGGVHTVYFMYLGMDVGSFFSVVFNEAPPPPPPPPAEVEVEEEAPAPVEETPAAPPPRPASPNTGDAGLVLVILALVSAAVFVRARAKSTR